MTEEQDKSDRKTPQRPANPAAGAPAGKPAAANLPTNKPTAQPPTPGARDSTGIPKSTPPAKTSPPVSPPPSKPSAPAMLPMASPENKGLVSINLPDDLSQKLESPKQPATTSPKASPPVAKIPEVTKPPSPPPEKKPAPVSEKKPAPEKKPESVHAAKVEGSPKASRFGKLREDQLVKEMPKMPEVEPEPEQPKEEPQPPPQAVTRPTIGPMYVVMIAPELAPVAKVGGLGDVTFGLCRELEIRGNSVEIILPKYDCMRYNHIWGLTRAYENLYVPWYGGGINCTVWFGFVHGRKCFFIEPHSGDNYFNRGVYYGHSDDLMRFAFFNRAALEFMLKTGKHPEIIHCHDWQTALVPVMLYEIYQHLGMRHSRVCYTIHNFRHQGVTGGQVLHATGLNRPEYYFHYDRLRDNHNAQALNLMKGGIVYSNFVTTVSPRHAWEAKDGGQGFGLEHTLHVHQNKYGGVLNGLDYDMFNPENDPHIPAHFNPATIEKKYENKRALRQRLWLADNEKPIISFIGRLDPQKGPELVRHAIFYALNNRAQFVLLGNSPEKSINDHFWGLKHHLNNSPDCHLEIGYNEELAHLIYAGSDMMIVPSRYEPCGLTQLIAMRYGTVPVVRSVGGLADTVFDKDHSNRALHDRNGYVFDHADNAGIESALQRGISCYYQFPEHFRNLLINGMKCDYSWNHPGQHYLNIYDYIRDK